MKDPHYKAYAALEAVEENKNPRDGDVQAIMRAIRNSKDADPDLRYAWEMFETERIRTILDAFLLGGALYDVIQRVTEIPIPVLKAYQTYLFDTSVFRNRMEAYNYVCEMQRYMDPQQSAYFQSVITGGPLQLQWLLGRDHKDRPQHTPVNVLEVLMVESMYKALATHGLPLTSQAARMGMECSKQAIQAAANLQRLNPADDVDALAELKLALRHEDHTIHAGIEGAPAPHEILH